MADNINGPGSWSGVANTLQDVLAQKRAEQHQKLIDSLNVVETQNQMRSVEQQRAQAKQNAQDEATYRAAQISESAADRASREKIAAMPPREAPESPMYTVGPTGKVTAVVDPTSKKPVTSHGNPLLELGFPPQPSAGSQPQLYQVPDPEHPGQIISHWLRPGEQPTDKTRIGGLAIRKGNEPVAGQSSGATTADVNALRAARGDKQKATEAGGAYFGFGGNDALDKANANIATIQARVIGTLPTPDLQADVRNIVKDKKAEGYSVDEIVAQLTQHRQEQGHPLTPAETAALQKTLPVVLGRF